MIDVTESVEAPEDTARAMRSRREFLRRSALAAVAAPAAPGVLAARRPAGSTIAEVETSTGASWAALPVRPPSLSEKPDELGLMQMTVIARDAWPHPALRECDTLNIGPGERWGVPTQCIDPGTWAFGRRILQPARSARGMFAMVTAPIVERPTA